MCTAANPKRKNGTTLQNFRSGGDKISYIAEANPNLFDLVSIAAYLFDCGPNP